MKVDLDGYTRHVRFTEAFQNPGILANEPTFLLQWKRLTIETERGLQGLAGQKALVVHTVGDKEKIVGLLLLFLILSPVLGVIVGQVSRRAEVGVAVSAGVFAMASFLQGLAAWLQE